MGERAKFFINEYSALHLLEKDNVDLDKFYNADLKVMVETAKKEMKRLNKQIKDARELLIKYMKMFPPLPTDDGARELLKLLGGNYTKDILNTRGDE